MKVLSNFIMKTDPVRELTTDIHTCQCILVENFFCIPEIGQWAFSTRLGGGSSTICDVFRCRRVSSHSAIICFQNSIPWPTTPPIIYQYHSVLWSGAVKNLSLRIRPASHQRDVGGAIGQHVQTGPQETRAMMGATNRMFLEVPAAGPRKRSRMQADTCACKQTLAGR